MELKKFDIEQGINAEIKRLVGIMHALDDDEFFKKDKDGEDVKDRYRGQVSECALQLERLNGALGKVHTT